MARYYWYVTGVDRRPEVVCVGRAVDSDEPFMVFMFSDLDWPEDAEKMDGMWLGPIQLPYLYNRMRWADDRRERRLKNVDPR